MLSSGCMSEIRDYTTSRLGATEKLFLIIISIEPISAYKISRHLKNGFFFYSDGMISTGIKSMAYKNVHKRVKRLNSLGLIEKLEGTFERNAIVYKLTTRGLLERLIDFNPLIPDILKLYKTDPIIETLVYQYFESKTIEKFEAFALSKLRLYLRKCCEAILSTIEVYRYETKFMERSEISNSELKFKHDNMLPGYIDGTIRFEAKNFVFDIVNLSKDEDPYQSDKDNRNNFPRQALLKDKRFIRLLQEIKNDFENGCKNYL